MEREQEIRVIAYHLWENEGCPEGREVAHWVEAELLWQNSHQLEAATEDTQPIEPREVTEEPAESVQASEKKPAQKRSAKTAKPKTTSRRRTPEKTIS
ncbi:MAG TPA: DUF2934 domain-containing protein [Candidatus Binatia bacterium]|jgi:hypothetical protein